MTSKLGFPNSKELNEKDDKELLTMLNDLQDKRIALQGQRHQYAKSGGFREVGKLQMVQKTIARINTILNLRSQPRFPEFR